MPEIKYKNKEQFISKYKPLVSPHLEYALQFKSPHFRRDIDKIKKCTDKSNIINIIIIIIIKKDWQCKAARGRMTPYQSEDPSRTLPTYRGKEEKGKIVEDKKGESN